ncbi:MAG: hypothetical protein ACRDZO_07355 [Egibacteraceae bacterium]
MAVFAHVGLDHLIVILPAVLLLLLVASAMTNRRGERKTSRGPQRSVNRR